MAKVHKRLTEAIQALLSDKHKFTESERTDAARSLRSKCEDRIYSGRRPEDERGGGAWVDMQIVGLDPSYTTSKNGISNGSQDFVEVVCHGWDSNEVHDMAAAVEEVLSSFRGSVKTSRGLLKIGSTWMVDLGENDPQKLPDASKRWEFMIDLTFGVRWQRDRVTVA